MTSNRDPEFLAAVAESDVAMNLYLSGLASGACSAVINWSEKSSEFARERGMELVARVQGDPIAMAQLTDAIRDIVYETQTAPRNITTYGEPNASEDR